MIANDKSTTRASCSHYEGKNVCLPSRLTTELLQADFHSAEFPDWTRNPLFVCENDSLNLNRMVCVTNISLCQIQSAWKILLSGKQPLDSLAVFY